MAAMDGRCATAASSAMASQAATNGSAAAGKGGGRLLEASSAAKEGGGRRCVGDVICGEEVRRDGHPATRRAPSLPEPELVAAADCGVARRQRI